MQCKLCAKELPTLGGNTTGLYNHLRTVHPNCVETDGRQSKLHSFGIGPQHLCLDQRQDKITDMLSGPTLQRAGCLMYAYHALSVSLPSSLPLTPHDATQRTQSSNAAVVH